ncbi:MAG: hypothetical protein WC415_00125 [Patescibacteria group bacterium]|jgi:hypothetical protein
MKLFLFILFILTILLFPPLSFSQNSSKSTPTPKPENSIEKNKSKSTDASIINQNFRSRKKIEKLIPVPPPYEEIYDFGPKWKGREQWKKVREWERFHPFV